MHQSNDNEESATMQTSNEMLTTPKRAFTIGFDF
jgi:hypothetical protein